MSFAQYQEEVDFANSYNPADKFAGFDRGDLGRADFGACDVGTRVIGRMTSGGGYRVIIVESYCDDDSFFEVSIDGKRVHSTGDRAQAITVAASIARFAAVNK